MTDLWQPLPTGTVLRSRYEIVSLLGKGGFGATYRARDRGRGGVECVVKELLPKHGDDPDVRRLFEREARVLQMLRFPGIPALQAYFSTSERHYLVQDFVEGVTLEQELERRERLPEGEVVDILEQALRILAYLHCLNPPVIHRDIKPANIMRGPDGRVSLLDFGTVKEAVGHAQIETAETMSMYRESVVVYSQGYGAPEQIRGVVAPASDLYALGATALRLVSGRAPERWYDALAGEWRFRGQLAIAPRLENVLTRMLEEQATRRFRSAEQVLEALQPHEVMTELGASPLPVGAKLADRYVIEAVIERHPDEIIYRARDCEALDHQCIVCAFMPAGGGSVEIHSAFAREGRALAAVSHPALPRLGAFFEESGTYYAIEEMIDGRPLADAVHPDAALSQAAIARALRSALEALAHLHQQSPPIIHRAVHPAHIIQASDGRVFLTGAGGLREAVLGRGRAMGHLARSQAYEAPGSGTRPAEPVDDLYGLGATAVYLLTAEPPNGSTPLASTPGVDPRFRAFLERLLEASPGARFVSSREALNALNALNRKGDVADNETHAKEKRGQLDDRLLDWEKWLRGLMSKKTAIGIAVVAVIAIAWWMKPVPPPSARVPSPTPAPVLYSNDLWTQRTFQPGQNDGCSWGYNDGGFLLGNYGHLDWCFYDIRQDYYGNIRVEVTAHLKAGLESLPFGLRFGARGSDNSEFYVYAISANGGHTLVHYRNSQWVNLYDWKRDGAVRQGSGALNRLAVELRGTTILTSLNGQSVGSARAPAEVRGRVGFIVYRSGTEAVFSDLRVIRLPAS